MPLVHKTLSRFVSSTALLTLGLGMGAAGTLLVQTYSAGPLAVESAKQKERLQPKLTTELLLKGEPSLGSANAPLTIVAFSDFECRYCQQFHQTVLPKLKQHYIEGGLIRLIHKDLPLPFHSQALPAAAAARCAGEQDDYWTMYDALFDAQNCLECKGVLTIAREQGMNIKQLQACMSRNETTALINANRSEAHLHGIRATPTFVIGPTRADDTLHGTIIEGALPWLQFKTMLDQQLNAINKP